MTDIDAEKALLIDELDHARRYTLAVLRDADENRIVHAESGWRVREMAAHILIWEEEALAALRARQQGERYTIADFDDFDAYNARAMVRYRDRPLDEIKTELHTVREEIKSILRAMPPERFAGMMVYPWPWMGSLSDLMIIMAGHERQHTDDIRQALQSG